MTDTTPTSPWEIPKSYDIGVGYYHRNLLKGNPVVERYFKQWLARIDQNNVERFFDYETNEVTASIRGNHPCEIHYDQIQRMVHNANLDLEIEKQIFYHLDYMDNKGIIDIRRVKEYFAYAGIEGVYDLEAGRHFQVPYDPPHAVDNLDMSRWSDADREEMARMMAKPGQIPNNTPEIERLEETLSTMLFESMQISGLMERLEAEGSKVGMAPDDSLEQMAEKSRRHAEETPGFSAYDGDMQAQMAAFEKRDDVIALKREIAVLKTEQAEKLAEALATLVPGEIQPLSDLSPRYTLEWDRGFEDSIGDTKRWATAFFDGKAPEDFPNDPPTEAELRVLDPVLVERGDVHLARYKAAFEEFQSTYERQIRVRNAAFKDWALQDFILSPVNKGEIAKVRKLDMPRDFANAVRAEMADGLMEKIKAPTRIERIQDGSGRYRLIMNEQSVGDFHPQEVLHMATEKDQAPEALVDERKKKPEDLEAERDAAAAASFHEYDDDDGNYIPNEPPPAQRKAEKARANTQGNSTTSEKPQAESRPYNKDAGSKAPYQTGEAPKHNGGPREFPGMNAMPGMQGMPGMGGMGMRPGMGGMGMPPPLFSFNANMPKINFRKMGMPSLPLGNRFNADAMASSINLKSQAVGSLTDMLSTGQTAEGQPLSAEQTLGAWDQMTSTLKSLSDDIRKTGKVGDRKLTPALGEAIKGAKASLDKAKPYVDDKAVEPGAVGEAARKAKQELDKLAKMIVELVKSILSLFGKRREAEPSVEP